MTMPMRTSGRAGLLLLAWIAGACGHGVVHVAPDESEPHVTWEIRTGGELGDARFVCGSAEPTRRCALAASAPGRPSLATVRLFLHAARLDTRYLGVMRVAFIEGAEQLLENRQVNVSVPPGIEPIVSTITGLVTAEAGRYSFSIALDALLAGAEVPVRIQRDVPVFVE